MAETFTWAPTSIEIQKSFRVLETEFGDGYKQRCPDGLNNLDASFNLSFENLYDDEAEAINDFLEVELGSDHFLFTPPRWSTQVKCVCKSWSISTLTNGMSNVKAKFEMVHDL